jgi:cyclic beta-1,2-glucan synthetase
MLYIRDERTGALWTPTPRPIRLENATYVIRHGQGYSRFQTAAYGIDSDLQMFVAPADPVKFCELTLTNRSDSHRRLSIASYVEWVLGPDRASGAAHIVTSRAHNGVILARNPWNAEFGTQVAFMDLCNTQTSWTGSRREFLGRHGRADAPAGLLRQDALSNSLGAEFDPCCALMTTVSLPPGASVTVTSILGQAASEAACVQLAEH